MKKGFTLVELLAVIVILGVIALIATNSIIQTIESSRMNSLMLNTEKTINAIEAYKETYELENDKELKNIIFKIENNRIKTLDLTLNGKLPKSGEVTINNDGDISIYAYAEGYCAVRGPLEKKVRVSKKNKNDCNYDSNSSIDSGNSVQLANGQADTIKTLTIYGNSVQEGIPSPDYPSEINSIGSENLFDYTKLPATNTVGGVTVINNNDGSFNVSSVGSTATTNENGKLRYDITDLLKKYGEQTYSISSGNGNIHPYIFIDLYYNGTNYYSWMNSSNSSKSIQTITKEMLFYSDFKAMIGIWYNNGSTIFNGIIYPSLKIKNLLVSDNINISITGKNIFDGMKYLSETGKTVNGINLKYNYSDDTYELNGTDTQAVENSADLYFVSYAKASASSHYMSLHYVSGTLNNITSFTPGYWPYNKLKQSIQWINVGFTKQSNGDFKSNQSSGTPTISDNPDYMGFYINGTYKNGAFANFDKFKFRIQLEEGTTATEYEPYKEIIVNYPVVLRSLPDGTKDKLVIDNVNKRAYVERSIGYKVFDGTEEWQGPARNDLYNIWSMQSQSINGYDNKNNEYIAISNMLKSVNFYNNAMYDSVSLHSNGRGSVIFSLSDSFTNLNSSSSEDQINQAFKDAIKSKYDNGTPITVQYKLATPIIEELEYIPVQNYDGITNIRVNSLTQPSNIEVVYMKNE